MKNAIALIFFALIPSLGFATEIQWTSSEPHGLIVFLETMVDAKSRPEGMKKYFEVKDDFKQKKTKKLIEQFRLLTKNQWEGVFTKLPDGAGVRPDDYKKFLSAAIRSTSLKELENKTRIFLKPDGGKKLFKILRNFQPIYRKNVWDPFYSQFIQQTDEIKTIYSKGGNELLNTIGTFYGVTDHFPSTLWVGFYPIIQDSGPTKAENLNDVQSVGILIGEKDPIGRLGVVLHEFSHFFFNERPKIQKDEMNAAFQTNNPYAKMAFQYFNETVATACGNGYVVEKINGVNNDPKWYNNEIIDKFSKAIYPMTKSYLESNQSMNKQFYTSVIDVFANTFPDILDQVSIAMGNVVVFMDTEAFLRPQIRSYIRSLFDVYGMMISSPIDVSENIEALAEHPNDTRVFLLSSKSIQDAKSFFSKTKELSPYISKLDSLNSPSYRIFRTKNLVPVILIKAETFPEIEKILKQLKDAKIPK